MKFVNEVGDLYIWRGSVIKWINVTPENAIDVLENAAFEILSGSLLGASTTNRNTIDKWFIQTGNPSDENLVTDSQETTIVKFGENSLKIVTSNAGGGAAAISISNPIRVYQKIIQPSDVLYLKNKKITFSAWAYSSNVIVRPFVVVSSTGNLADEVEVTISTNLLTTNAWEQLGPFVIDIPTLTSGSPSFTSAAYIKVGYKIGATGTTYLDGAMLVDGDLNVSPFVKNILSDEIVAAKQGKDRLVDLLGLITNLETTVKTDFVSAINSIITYDISVNNLSELTAALDDITIKFIFIKNGVFTLTQSYDISGKIAIVGESKEDVIITFPDNNGFTIPGDISIKEGGTITAIPGSTAIVGVGTSFSVNDIGKYIFIGSKTYNGT